MTARAIAAVVLLAAISAAQSVRRVDWGFDGAAVSGRFNLLSVLVENPTDDPLDTELILTRRTTLGGQLGAPIVKPCFVAPRSRRWVQFTPYVTSRRQPWSVRFAREELAGADVPRPAAGEPALVLLDTVGLDTALSFLVPVYPVERFPTSLAATEGLGAVVLDRPPEWESSRRQTFLDWVRSGGTVHLIRGFRGWPTFSDELDALNGPGEITLLGAGRVVKHEYTRSELQRRVPEEMLVDTPSYADGIEAAVTSGLQSRIEVAHDWWLIDLLAIVYVGAVGPWVFLIARRTASWRRTLGVLALVIAVASVAFSIAGARGIGETAVLHSMTFARPLDDGRWNTVQYANVFVTIGGEYVIESDGEQDVFTTAQVYEPVRGKITEGVGARLVADLPQFSWRSFVHQRVVSAPPISIAAEGPWQGFGRPPRITIEHGPGLPVRRPLAGVCIWDGLVWVARFDGDHAAGFVAPRQIGDLAEVFAQLAAPQLAGDSELALQDREALLQLAGPIAVDRTVNATIEDSVVLYVVAEPGEEFAARAEGLGEDNGLALFRFDLPVSREGR